MKQLLALIAFSALSPILARAEKGLEIKATVNLEMNLKMIVTHHTDEGTHYLNGKVVSVKKEQGTHTHQFEVDLPGNLTKKEADSLVITLIKDEGEFVNPMGYGLTLCSLPLREIPEGHVKVEFIERTLDVTGHYHPEERHHLSVEGPQGFRNGTVAWPRKADDGRILVDFHTILGETEITMASMEHLENIARAKVKEDIQWKKWAGTVLEDKPTVWTYEKD